MQARLAAHQTRIDKIGGQIRERGMLVRIGEYRGHTVAAHQRQQRCIHRIAVANLQHMAQRTRARTLGQQ